MGERAAHYVPVKDGWPVSAALVRCRLAPLCQYTLSHDEREEGEGREGGRERERECVCV